MIELRWDAICNVCGMPAPYDIGLWNSQLVPLCLHHAMMYDGVDSEEDDECGNWQPRLM